MRLLKKRKRCLNEIVVGFDSDEEFNEENNMVDADVEIEFH